MSNKDIKRIRAANYTPDEKILLLQIIKQYKGVIENKKTDQRSSKEKELAWQKIGNQFNAQFPNKVYRSLESLKKYYENIKKKVRKDVANDKVKRFATGGGTYTSTIDPTTELVMTVLNNKTVHGLNNPYDLDAEVNEMKSDLNEEINENNFEELGDIEIILDENQDNINVGSTFEKPISNEFNQDDDENQNQCTNVKLGIENAASSLKKSISKKLIKETPRTSWASRRRPTTSASLSSTQLQQKYSDLSDAKMELVSLQKQALMLDVKLKEKELSQMEEEHKLKMKLYEVQIEKARKFEDS